MVFDGSDDYHARINDPALGIDERTILVIRGAGPLGWPGSAEVVNMQPPDALLKRGITSLPTIGDGRQSGTSDSPSILNASPESAAGGGLAWLRTGDVIRIDLVAGRCDMLVADAGDRAPQGGRAAAGAGERHAMAGVVSRHGGPARSGRGDGARRQVPRRRAQDAAPQSLRRCGEASLTRSAAPSIALVTARAARGLDEDMPPLLSALQDAGADVLVSRLGRRASRLARL